MSDNEAREKAIAKFIQAIPVISPRQMDELMTAFGAGYDAAKAEPQAIDREALIGVMHEAYYDDASWSREFVAMADAVITHLSAQEAATEVEWEYRRVRPDGRPVLFVTFESPPELDEGWSMQRTPAPIWQEVLADEYTAS